MADMIKFFKGLEANLPQSGVNGALYITTDEGAIYLGTGTGMKRLGDFVQVANVDSLPEKAHESCLYYCVAENILAKWNGTEWKQINKQPTAEEMKTLLGLGSMAYLSEVAEDNLSSALKEKVNAAAEGNHSHANKDVLDGISAEKVAAWDAAEGNAKSHADGLNTAMNTRVEALEAIDHTHANAAELDLIASGDKAKWDTAAGKAHEHANAEELAKIVDGDKAKWDAVAADHLTSADKTTLENSIKEAKKAGTDANTNIETYKVSNDARVLAVEEDIAEITNAESGILAQAKTYADGKDTAIAEAKAAGTAASTALGEYKTSNDAAVAAVKATADAAAVKSEVETALAGKVNVVTGKSLVDDAEITKLAGVSAGANKVEASENGKIKIDGVDTVVYTHPDKHAITDVDGLQAALDGKQAAGDYAAEEHTHTKSEITDFAHTHTASEVTDLDATIKAYDYATKTEAQGYADAKDKAIEDAQAAADKAQEEVDALELVVAEKAAQADLEALESYVGTIPDTATATNIVAYVQEKTAGIATDTALEELTGRVAQAEKDIDAIEADYLKDADKTELSGLVTAEKTRAEGIEAGLRSDVDAIKGDYLKAADKEALQTQINTIMNNPDAEGAINSINEFTQYVKDHGTIAEGMRTDINKNKEDIAAINNADTGVLKQAKDYADGLAGNYAAADHDHVAADITDFESAVATKVESYGYATTGYADGKAAAAQSAAEATAAGALASAKSELEGKIADGDAAVEAKVTALAGNVYTKEHTFTKEEVAAAITAAIEEAHTWGEF